MQRYLKQGVLALTLTVALSFLIIDSPFTRARAITQASQAPATQPAEKAVEETHKNIQVLKGLPESQLRPLMNLVATSLGVTCATCHVKNGNEWEWDKDDKKAKKTARKMMQMTIDINKASFDGKPEVTCFTCHQGHEHPVIMPSLPLPARAAAPAASPAAPTTNFVTPQQVLAKYVQAVGGKEAAEKLKTRVLKGTLVTSNGQSLPLEVRVSGPDKLLTMVTTQQGVSYQALGGESGWIKNNREQRAMNGVEIDRIRSLAWSLDPLRFREPYPRLTFGGVEKIGDREANVLRMVTPDKKRVRLFFDKETGLLVRRIVMTDLPIGPNPEQTDFEDYRDVDGVNIPFTIRTSYLDNFYSGTRKFTEVRHNVTIDETEFSPPAPRK